jgi:hypothetical protein
VTQIANLLPVGNFTNGHVYTATGYDADAEHLFAVIADEYKSSLAMAVLDVPAQALTTNLLTSRQHEHFGAEIVMQGLWLNDTKKFVLFLQAVSDNLGFDQIMYFDPYTGKGTFMFSNLMDNLIGFECDPAVKTCDRLQTAAYDVLTKRMYFQGTQYESTDDDLGTTALFYADISHRYPYIDQALDPFTFGFMDFQFVQVVSDL